MDYSLELVQLNHRLTTSTRSSAELVKMEASRLPTLHSEEILDVRGKKGCKAVPVTKKVSQTVLGWAKFYIGTGEKVLNTHPSSFFLPPWKAALFIAVQNHGAFCGPGALEKHGKRCGRLGGEHRAWGEGPFSMECAPAGKARKPGRYFDWTNDSTDSTFQNTVPSWILRGNECGGKGFRVKEWLFF